jgi:hypothetical protein
MLEIDEVLRSMVDRLVRDLAGKSGLQQSVSLKLVTASPGAILRFLTLWIIMLLLFVVLNKSSSYTQPKLPGDRGLVIGTP